MDKFYLFIICLYLVISPFYVFDSGLPQPADYLALTAVLGFVLSGKIKRVIHYPIVKSLKYLFIIILIVSIATQFYLLNNGMEGSPYLAIIYYAYNFLIFLLILYLIKLPKFTFYISLFVLISISLQVTLSVFGIGKGLSRETIFFNNPNQLGYFALLVMSIFVVTPSILRKNKIISFLVTILCAYLVLLSGSRASLVGIFVLGIILFVSEGFRFEVKSFLFLLFVLIISINFLISSDWFVNQWEVIENRSQAKESTFESEWEVRGYDRILLYPEYILYGAGEMANKRFTKSLHQLEIHSAFGNILFSYGILGFFFFIKFLYQIIKQRLLLNLLIMSPVLLYNLTHQGLRFTQFWIFLALVFIYSYQESKPKSINYGTNQR